MSKQTSSKSPAIDLNDKYDKADLLGTLIVVLLKARNLNDKHSFRKSDVFAQATLNGAQKRTNVDIKGGQHPEWDGEVRFPILKSTGAKFRKMEVSCYSMEPRSEDLMGKGTVDISDTLRTGEFDDWVQLEVDGVPRGELYLEMTYYANAPAPTLAVPNKLISAIVNENTGLSRRPSKLSPAERLSRPQQQNNISAIQSPTPQHRPQGNSYPSRPSRLTEVHSPTRHDTPLMPGSYPDDSKTSPNKASLGLPANQTSELPNGGEVAPSLIPGPPKGGQQQPAPLPTILRPGLGGAAPARQIPQHGVVHGRHSSDPSFAPADQYNQGSPPSHNPYLGGNGSSGTSSSQPSSPPRNPYISSYTAPANPYITDAAKPSENQRPNAMASPNFVGPTITQAHPYPGYQLGMQPRGGTPLLWQQENTGSQSSANTSFAFPTPNVPPVYADFSQRPSGSQAPQSVNNGYRPHHTSSRDDRDFEPSLQARYQSPLPLPPRSGRPAESIANAQNSAARTESVQASHPAYTKPPTSPPKATIPALDQSRRDTLRWAEEDAARRREQELKDLELAMQLDRELNLADERAAAR